VGGSTWIDRSIGVAGLILAVIAVGLATFAVFVQMRLVIDQIEASNRTAAATLYVEQMSRAIEFCAEQDPAFNRAGATRTMLEAVDELRLGRDEAVRAIYYEGLLPSLPPECRRVMEHVDPLGLNIDL